ncbi:hypothetical protein BD414DRAFT_529435 [Trametes punicea]|nr:hypothetical protein BD414DRAFT_529435 [Trametes punicea]
MSPRPGQRCAKELPKLQKALRQLEAKEAFSVFQARVVKQPAAVLASTIKKRPGIGTLQPLSNPENWMQDTRRAQGGGDAHRGAITTPSCTESPPSGGGDTQQRHDEPRNGAILGAEGIKCTVQNHQDLVRNPNEMQGVNLLHADSPPSPPLVPFSSCAPPKAVASAEARFPYLNMPTFPPAQDPPYRSKPTARLGTMVSAVREPQSSLVKRSSRRRYRNLDGPLDRRFQLESNSLSAGGKEIAANLGSHRVDGPIGVSQVEKPLLDAPVAPDRRLSQCTLALESAPEPPAAVATPLKRTGDLEANGMVTSPSPVRRDFSATSSAELLLTVGYTHARDEGAQWAVADHHTSLHGRPTAPLISSYSALADALVMPDCNV